MDEEFNGYCIDLFSGTESFSAAFEKSRQWDTLTIDLNPENLDEIQPDMERDILDLDASDIPIPENDCLVVLASPPCKAFSLAAAHHHMTEDVEPKTDFGETSIKLVEKTISLIEDIDPDFSFIENPASDTRRVMRQKDWGLGEPTGTVTYCQYGFNRMKKTDLWGEHPDSFKYRSCKNGQDCHASAPRGSKTGTQGINSSIKRSMLPYGLSLSILEAVERDWSETLKVIAPLLPTMPRETDEIEQALDNLRKIKEGESESVQAQASPEPTDEPAETDALSLAESEVDRLFEEHDEVRQNVDRENVHVFVARWNGRNGVCKYGRRLRNKRRFGKRVPTLPRNHEHHAIGANEKILEQGNREGFLDVVRHELAHAVAYEKYGTSQKHNANWRAMASKLGADPKANHDKRDREDEYQYYAYCPECGNEYGKTKRSKTIKLPFRYGCGKCGTSGLSSYKKGQAPPDEHGIVKVESIPWEDKSTWWKKGSPRSLS